MKYIYLITMLLMVVILQSCTREPFQEEVYGSKGTINIKLSTRSLELSGTNPSKVRIIVHNKNQQRINLNATNLTDKSEVAGEGLFVVSVPAGEYSFYAIANEPDNLTTQLDAISTLQELNDLIIQPENPFTETTVMLAKKVDASIAIDANGRTTVNGSVSQLLMELERVYTKVSLKINKQTVNPADKFTIKKVDFMQSPDYSYLNAKIYDGANFVSRELFSGSVELATNGDPAIEIIKAITAGTPAEPSNIFAEHLLADGDKSTHDKAAYFGILATYTPSGMSPQDVYYKIPVGDYNGTNAVDGAGHDYNLKRNYHYDLNVKITKMGDKDAVEIQYTVKPWTSEWIDVEIEGDPFLDVSNIEVDVYDAAATRIYFHSNMPNVQLDPMLLNGTQSVAVNNLFENLTGVGAKNFVYTYDVPSNRGEGYFDLINTHTDNAVINKRLLYLKSGKLVREIAATTRVSAESAKKNVQPSYIGTFHRASERGERIISWDLPTTTQWKVEIVTDNSLDGLTSGAQYYTDAADLRVDRLASPNHARLYTLDPPDAEGAFVSEEIVNGIKTPITKIEGQGRIYFRVGWANTIPYTDHRYAKIKVTTSADNFATQMVSYLYCRQGEEPQAITAGATRFSCYNVSTPEQFVDYPTKSGYLYQWNRTQSWAVTGTVNNIPKGDVSDPTKNNGYVYSLYDDQTYVCPAKYSYPDATAVTVMNAALTGTSLQWGYYADGFFDRRAVTNNIVRGVSGETASAGVLFFSPTTGISIFMPTASWRNYDGVINSDLGLTGYYWSMPQEGEWSPTTTLNTATLNAISLRVSGNLHGSAIEALNKASTASVRCMRLEGKTVYFDANGGVSTPRSVTMEMGNVTLPAGPIHRDRLYSFSNWTATRSGTGASYNAGDAVDINTVGDKTWYAQYKKIGYMVNGKVMLVSEVKAGQTWAYAKQICDQLNADTGLTDWRLPNRVEISGLFNVEKTLFAAGTNYWTSEPVDTTYYVFYVYGTGTTTTFYDFYPNSSPISARCVRVLP